MDNILSKPRPTRQQQYRKRQTYKGLVRFELQVPEAAKRKFDEMVEAVAEELEHLYDKKRRLAQARVQVFEQITAGIEPQFRTLKNQIESLKSEVKALAPKYFQETIPDQIPIPETIQSLPDNPEKLKTWLTQTYQELQQTKLLASKYQARAQQFEALYNSINDYNESLKHEIALLKEQYLIK